jgi:hypothetical protein
MTTGDKIALISLIFTVITTGCVLFLAYAALAQTARPKITVQLLSPAGGQCLTETNEVFVFQVVNVGRWYGSPMAVDVTVYCNFPEAFSLRELRYGSMQEHSNTRVKAGKGGMRYLKAEGLKLSRRESGEMIHIQTTTPKDPGEYRIRVTGYSANDASFFRVFRIACGRPLGAMPNANRSR